MNLLNLTSALHQRCNEGLIIEFIVKIAGPASLRRVLLGTVEWLRFQTWRLRLRAMTFCKYSVQIYCLCYNAVNMEDLQRFANNNNNNDNDDRRIVGRSLG